MVGQVSIGSIHKKEENIMRDQKICLRPCELLLNMFYTELYVLLYVLLRKTYHFHASVVVELFAYVQCLYVPYHDNVTFYYTFYVP
jgi:hypothetical protein